VVLAPAWYGAALALFLFLYYAGHAALFGGFEALPVI
jgi:hypothetical protein